MATLLEAADLVISRSGGSTVAELSAIGIASVLVPLPIAPRDHQRFNAEMLSSVGAAVIVADADCTAQRLAELMKELSARPETLQTMGAAARSIGRPDAADRIADLLLTLAKHP
jgi:UDP-N-acetylglucosamine:LPS N-acetylglucosamine transferase